MPRWKPQAPVVVALLALVILPMALRAEAAESAQANGPKLVVEKPDADLGEIVRGHEVTHDFIIRNDGTEPLEISRVETSCPCALPTFDDVVPPGASGKVTVEFKSLKVNGKGDATLVIDSNDPDKPSQELRIVFNVVSRINATPGYARWITVRGEREGTIGETLWAVDGEPFEVLDVETPEPYIRATFRPATKAEENKEASGPQWRVNLTVDSMSPIGPIEGMALVHVNHPEQKVVPIPLSGFVRPLLFVEPQTGDWGKVKMDGVEHALFAVRNFGSKPIAITGVEPGIDGVTAKVAATKEGYRYQVELTFDPDKVSEGPFDATLRIKTNSDLVPALDVPLKGTFVDVRKSK